MVSIDIRLDIGLKTLIYGTILHIIDCLNNKHRYFLESGDNYEVRKVIYNWAI